MSWSTSELRVRLALLTRFKPSSKIFYWPFQDGTSFVDLLWFCSVLCLLCLCARLFLCALWSPAGKGLTSWLSFVVSNCEFVTFPLVSWVRCGTWLYRFLIFAPLLTFTSFDVKFTRICLENVSWIAQQSLWIQHVLSKPCSVNLVSKDTPLVFSIYQLQKASDMNTFKPGPKVIKLFSCSTQLSCWVLINVKMPTIVGI